MPTSSIFDHVVISGEENVEKFLEAMEEAEKEPPYEFTDGERPEMITDPEEIRKMFEDSEKQKKERKETGRKEITSGLLKKLEKKINPKNDPRIYTAREVTFDYGTADAVRVDYMRFCPKNNSVSGIEKGDFYCYEIKSSVEDFHSGHGLNFIGDYNYLVTTQDVYEKIGKEVPYGVGVMTETDDGTLETVKPAKRRNRERPMAEMLLMMFRSAARDLNKAKNPSDKK